MGHSRSRRRSGRDKLPDLPILRNQKKWNIIKVVLRSIALLLSIIDIAELIAIETARNALDYWPSVAYPVLGGFLLWDIVEFVVIASRGSISKGMHPGAHVGVELILWLGCVFTVSAQAYKANWGQLVAPDWVLEAVDIYPWSKLALTQFVFLSTLLFLRFIFFVRACVEVDRLKKDRRLQQLVFAIQKQGRDPQEIPLSAFRAVRETNEVTSSTVINALSTATRSSTTRSTMNTLQPSTPQQLSRSSAEERDFAFKYNFPITTVPELLESGIHPEDARNQKVLIGAFPR
ncbi:hypothetical protein SAMD00023353_0602330 [Rosellinia necatrix]|uniref:Uncharacterized protein n=1 Tax=Rosellinia necatrix TaxID=77044 RepID=A0A1S7ULQ7_ROSNE|nr:hypothetical protein SAMD00023353_0602330 [Rosellinia necatrix]